MNLDSDFRNHLAGDKRQVWGTYEPELHVLSLYVLLEPVTMSWEQWQPFTERIRRRAGEKKNGLGVWVRDPDAPEIAAKPRVAVLFSPALKAAFPLLNANIVTRYTFAECKALAMEKAAQVTAYFSIHGNLPDPATLGYCKLFIEDVGAYEGSSAFNLMLSKFNSMGKPPTFPTR